jgi:hypothetical protein
MGALNAVKYNRAPHPFSVYFKRTEFERGEWMLFTGGRLLARAVSKCSLFTSVTYGEDTGGGVPSNSDLTD